MKLFSLVMYIVVVLVCGVEVDAACIQGVPRTIFSASFPASQSALRLTEQCFGAPTYSAEDLNVLPPRKFVFPPEKEQESHPGWTPWLTQEFVLPPGTATNSVYTLTLVHDGNAETVWTIKLFGTDILPTIWPIPFYVGDVVQQHNTVWVFFWKEPYYYFERQEQQHGEWNNTASLRLERPYANETHATILVDGEHIGVRLILLGDATYEPHSTTLVDGETIGVKLTLKDGTEEYWRVEGEQLVKQAQQ